MFLDTNILVYSFDRGAPEKAHIAQGLIEQGLETRNGAISTQVIQEFLNLATRRFRKVIPSERARVFARSVLSPLCKVRVGFELLDDALGLHIRWQYSFYDSLIIAAALRAGCRILYSEDLQHDQNIDGLRIVNPFLPA